MKKFFYENESKSIGFYKDLLKNMSDINLRRISKFNLLALFGALKCLENVSYSKNLNIYMITKLSTFSTVIKVLQDQKENNPVMPFDFLNINSSNSAYYIASAINTCGLNMVLTTKNCKLEDGLKLAKLDLELGDAKEALIGLVDESSNEILNDNSKDISKWIYLN